jgi:hypothetical protein
LWDDTYTNQRGKTLEEFIITSNLLLMNEATGIPTFETIRGRSWSDLTLCYILAQNTAPSVLEILYVIIIICWFLYNKLVNIHLQCYILMSLVMAHVLAVPPQESVLRSSAAKTADGDL